MKELTYLIYCLGLYIMTMGGCSYVVFVLGHSGWWFVLAVLVCCSAYTPERWIHGIIPKESEEE